MKSSLSVPFVTTQPVSAPRDPGVRDELALRFHVTSGTLSLAVAALGLAALAGWALNIPALTSVFPGFTTMKVNAAVAFVLTGVALWRYRDAEHVEARDALFMWCAGSAAFIGAITTLEHLTGWSLHIDQLLPIGRDVSGLDGRMALSTAVSLVLVNAAMLIAGPPRRYPLVQALVAGAIMLATLNGAAYFFGLSHFGDVDGFNAMAVHSAVCILLASTAMFFARPDQGVMVGITDAGAGGLAIRQLLPAIFILPVMLAWLSWQGVRMGWYGPGVGMAVFVALATNVLAYAVWAGGLVLCTFDHKRVAAETERVLSEERLRRAISDAPVPTIIHDTDGRILHMSSGWSSLSGFSVADTPTISAWIDAARPDGPEPFDGYLGRVADGTDTVHGGVWTIRAAGGLERAWEFSTTPVGVMGSAHRALVTMAVDITDRQHAEAELRRANEHLEQRIATRTAELTTANDALRRQSDQLKEQATLLDLVRDGILVRDLYGTIIYWSAGAAELYGWTPAEALGGVSHRLLHAEYPKPVSDIERQVMSTGYWEGEVVQVTKSGARLEVESRWTLTRTERGVPQGFLEVNRDISARKRAQDSVRDSEVRFRSVAETAIEGIISTDEHGVISYWNPGAERLFGRTAAETIGKSVEVALPDKVLAPSRRNATSALVGTTFETVGRRSDGTSFPVELSLSEWTTSQGARFFTGIARDITGRKDAERALEAKASELARSNQELEQFAYVASHDLQEPLRMVSNYTQLLARRYKDRLDPDANEFIEFAVDGARRMQDLIRDLLEYARVGTRGKEFKVTSVDRIVTNALVNLSGAIDEAGAEVNVGPMPTFACDASQLGQVFQNLIGNAIKFRRPGAKPVINVSATAERNGWAICIRDNGIGIDAKHFGRIFQMFQRLHGRGEYSGTGIGLALCKKIVERHNGRIRVESTPGKGTTFVFTIPALPAAAAEQVAAGQDGQA